MKEKVGQSILSPALHAARALAITEQYLQDWQDDPSSPRADVDKMLFAVRDIRHWVRAHLVDEVDITHSLVYEIEGTEVTQLQV